MRLHIYMFSVCTYSLPALAQQSTDLTAAPSRLIRGDLFLWSADLVLFPRTSPSLTPLPCNVGVHSTHTHAYTTCMHTPTHITTHSRYTLYTYTPHTLYMHTYHIRTHTYYAHPPTHHIHTTAQAYMHTHPPYILYIHTHPTHTLKHTPLPHTPHTNTPQTHTVYTHIALSHPPLSHTRTVVSAQWPSLQGLPRVLSNVTSVCHACSWWSWISVKPKKQDNTPFAESFLCVAPSSSIPHWKSCLHLPKPWHLSLQLRALAWFYFSSPSLLCGLEIASGRKMGQS